MMATRFFIFAYLRVRLILLLFADLRRVADMLNQLVGLQSAVLMCFQINTYYLLTQFIKIILIFVLNSTAIQ